MEERKRHDSLAPKGAFGVESAAQAERAAAKTADLVARQPSVGLPDMDHDEPEISVAFESDPADSVDLCADELIPSDSDRVSVEDAMRALIDMRLERTRPSDEFGTFDAQSATASAPPKTLTPVTHTMNSLAPIELTPATTAAVAPSAPKRSPLPLLAAAALVLLGVGVYRRIDRAPAAPPTQPQAAAQTTGSTNETSVASPMAAATEAEPEGLKDEPAIEPVAEFKASGTSESEDAILTLGTPTIVNVEAPTLTKATVGPAARAAKEAPARQATVAPRVTPEPEAVLPEAPSRAAIVAGFNSVRDEVLACANGSGGVAPIEATIVGDGRITHATVGGYYQGTPQGSCIARALRQARFAPFARESIKVEFPYTL